MPTRSTVTTVSPLPSSVTREAAIAQLHDHTAMIEMNPLVIHHELTGPPEDAPPDEALMGTWYDITDRISYFPGFKGEVTYKACFYDLPNGLQTHTYAPAGLDLKGKFSICGNRPGEPRESPELGINVPRDCLYLKEEIEMQCSVLLAGFVKKNIKKSHKEMANKLIARAAEASAAEGLTRWSSSTTRASTVSQAPTSPTPTSPTHRKTPSTLHSARKNSQSLGRSATKRLSARGNCNCTDVVHVRDCPRQRPGYVPSSPGARPYAASISDQSQRRSSSSRHSTAAPRAGSHSSMQELSGLFKKGQCLCTGRPPSESCSSYADLWRPGTWEARPRTDTMTSADATQMHQPVAPVQ